MAKVPRVFWKVFEQPAGDRIEGCGRSVKQGSAIEKSCFICGGGLSRPRNNASGRSFRKRVRNKNGEGQLAFPVFAANVKKRPEEVRNGNEYPVRSTAACFLVCFRRPKAWETRG